MCNLDETNYKYFASTIKQHTSVFTVITSYRLKEKCDFFWQKCFFAVNNHSIFHCNILPWAQDWCFLMLWRPHWLPGMSMLCCCIETKEGFDSAHIKLVVAVCALVAAVVLLVV
jgi:hypothetical protein